MMSIDDKINYRRIVAFHLPHVLLAGVEVIDLLDLAARCAGPRCQFWLYRQRPPSGVIPPRRRILKYLARKSKPLGV